MAKGSQHPGRCMGIALLCQRENHGKNVLSEARDPRHHLRDSVDHVTGGSFRPKSKSVWSWWYSPREFDPKEAPQAAKNPRILSGAPKLLGINGSISPPGALMRDSHPPKGAAVGAPCCVADGLVKKLERMVKGENEPIDELKGRLARAPWST